MYALHHQSFYLARPHKAQYVYAAIGLLMAIATVFAIGRLEMFLVLAAGVFFGAVLPGILSLRRD